MNIEVPPKVLITVIVAVVAIAGLLIYRGVSGPSQESVEQNLQAMHQKMINVPGRPPNATPPAPVQPR